MSQSPPPVNPANIAATGGAKPPVTGAFAMQQQTPPEQFDFAGIVTDLNNLLRLKTTVIGIKMFARAEDMAAIPKIRRPSSIHTTDQTASWGSGRGGPVATPGEVRVGARGRGGTGLAPKDEKG